MTRAEISLALAPAVTRADRVRRSPVARIYSATLVTQVLGLALTTIVARLLAPDEFALLTELVIYSSVIPSLFSCGISDALVTTRGFDHEDVVNIYSSGVIPVAVLALVAGAVTWIVATILPDGDRITVTILSLSVVVSFLSSWIMSLEQRLECFGDYNRQLIWTNVIPLALMLPLVLRPEWCSVAFFLATRFVGNTTVLAQRFYFRRNFLHPVRRADRGMIRSITVRGLRFHTTALLNVFSGRLDQVMATAFLSSSGLATYGAVLPMSVAMKSLGNAVSTVGLVRVSSVDAQEAKASSFSRQLRLSIVASFVMALPICLLMPVLFPLLLGPRYVDVGKTVILVIVGGTLFSLVDIEIRLLRGLLIVWPGVAARVATIGSVLLLAPTVMRDHGAVGAGAVSVATAVVTLVVLAVGIRFAVARNLTASAQGLD